jgi:hypothetical protein
VLLAQMQLLHLLTAGFGTSRTSRDVRLESAKWAKADIDQVANRLNSNCDITAV